MTTLDFDYITMHAITKLVKKLGRVETRELIRDSLIITLSPYGAAVKIDIDTAAILDAADGEDNV